MFENEFTWGKAVASNTIDEFHASFDNAVIDVKKEIGREYPIIINGKEIHLENRFVVSSPADRNIKVAEFPKATEEDVLNEVIKWKQKRRPPLNKKDVAVVIRNLGILKWFRLQPSADLPIKAF